MPRILAVLALALAAAQAAGAPPTLPAARKVPGLNAPDAFPNGCVDCHVATKERDVRISVLLGKWSEKVEPKLLEAAKASSADPSKVKGKHPKTPAALKSIPAGCMTCHKKDSKIAPSFARLMHAVHLGGGDQGPFLTLFQGECLTCHKLDAKTGVTRIPSAPEK